MKKKSFMHCHNFSLLLLSISSLSKTQYPLTSTPFLPFLTQTLSSSEDEKIKITAVSTLFNLTTNLQNSKPIVASGITTHLLNFSANETSLATLANLAASPVGKKAICNDPSVIYSLTNALASDKCQELATHLLMIVAYASVAQRERMSRSDVVPVILEVALLGTAVARRRALKLLEWFKDARVGVHSGPQERWAPRFTGEEEGEEGRRAVESMVKQSLDKNMASIMRRAVGMRSFVASSSSKSLPY